VAEVVELLVLVRADLKHSLKQRLLVVISPL
jgi:hypothetical protein